MPLINRPSLHVEMLAMPLAVKDHRADRLIGGISFDLVHRPYGQSRSTMSN